MTRPSPRARRRGRALALAFAAAAAACGPGDLPGRHVRVADGAPSGPGADPSVAPTIGFTGAVDPEGLRDGRRLRLAREADRTAALAAIESEAGAGPDAPGADATAELVEGGSRVVVRPAAPLPRGSAWALLLSSRARDADGRPVLDADGRQRPTVLRFTVATVPPPAVRIAAVLAAAATPQAAGEFVAVLDLGPGALDLAGWRLEKRLPSGSWSGCTAGEGRRGTAASGELALLVGGAWDDRYPDALATPIFPCGATALAGGLADDRAPELRLFDPSGKVAATWGP
jgi:hypothetical protein